MINGVVLRYYVADDADARSVKISFVLIEDSMSIIFLELFHLIRLASSADFVNVTNDTSLVSIPSQEIPKPAFPVDNGSNASYQPGITESVFHAADTPTARTS